MSITKTIVLGDEYDDEVRTTLMRVLQNLGARVSPEQSGVGGSQEFSSYRAELRGELLVIEAETYVGLSLSGPAHLVDEVAATIRRERAPNVDHPSAPARR